MNTPSWQRALVPAGVLAAALLSGCVIAPARPYYPPEDAVVTAPPPPPREEIIGVAPYPGYVWLGGHWGWSGRSHVWIGGRWDAPRRGHYWAPHGWVPRGGGWVQRPGRWERR
jgi:WXXGXW repeat (2 copies)